MYASSGLGSPKLGSRSPPRRWQRPAHSILPRCGANKNDDEESSTNEIKYANQDWRTFRAKLVQQQQLQGKETQQNMELLREQDSRLADEQTWVHPSPLEQGCLIVASSQLGMEGIMSEFWQTVIFILEHSAQGSVGIILNRPSILCLDKAMLRGTDQSDTSTSRLSQKFPKNRLYFGGYHKQEIISMIHGFYSIGGTEVRNGIFVGGYDKACDAISNARGPQSFKFFAGCVIWKPGELQREIDSGLWYSATSSRNIVLKQCLSLPVPLWVEVLRLMGGSYEDEANKVYGNSGPQ